jgi:hypothetical protein
VGRQLAFPRRSLEREFQMVEVCATPGKDASFAHVPMGV